MGQRLHIIEMMIRYTLLSSVAIVSSMIIQFTFSVKWLFSLNGLHFMDVSSIVVMSDSLVKMICIILYFTFEKNRYVFWCGCFHSLCKKVCF